MIKFVTIIDGKVMLYTQYDTGNCCAKPVLDDRAEFISRGVFDEVRKNAKEDPNVYYEEIVK